ncbi:MAG: serine/threonine protein kinase [Planctomycetes bacterium]|nr:serine/threonine protein kinase [Planctomycetota bacterium]
MSAKSLTLFDLAPGKELLGLYTIRRAHRQGGMSTTFEVQDKRRDAVCEVQVFPSALFENADQGREFADSLKAWTRVDSPHVLRARDVHVTEDGSILYVTDMPAGGSLREWLRVHPVSDAATVIELGSQLLAGLSAVHAAGLVHGDIKPHTIQVEDGKRFGAVLTDGGITPGLWTAKHLGDKTALIGTPFYAPIEQFGGESPNVQSDVYNVATVLCEAATGTIPWRGKSFIEVFQSKLEKRPPTMRSRAPKVEVPAELEKAIAGGLMADKGERYATAEDFRKRLLAAKEG